MNCVAYLSGEVILQVDSDKYLDHHLTNDLHDDLDIRRQCRPINVRGNIIFRKFHMCSLSPSHTRLRPPYGQVTTYLRPKNGPIVEKTYVWSQRSYDWSQRSCVIARGKSVAARSWSCSKPSHTGLTTRLRSKNVGIMGQS